MDVVLAIFVTHNLKFLSQELSVYYLQLSVVFISRLYLIYGFILDSSS